MTHLAQKGLARLGQYTRTQWQVWQHYAAVLGTIFIVGVRWRYWPRTVRAAFVRQVYFSGVEAMRFIIVVALLAGLSVVVQAEMWTQRAGQSQLLGPLLVAVVARELAPLFANFILIVRSGSAITTELSLMKIGGEVRALEAQGLDPFVCLVMPRVLGLAVAAFALTVFFIPVAFAGGYGFAAFFGLANVDPAVFLRDVFRSVAPIDAVSIILKSVVPALLTGVICSTEGLNVGRATTNVPINTKRALTKSVGVLFVVSALISVLAYR
jgi:phospholipid/cholesterol/gamma-HCH transport system permease protein